jgi:hypothetical protein
MTLVLITVTMDTYSHVTPTVQREAVELLTSVLNTSKCTHTI